MRKVVQGDETSFSYERKIRPMPKLGPWVRERLETTTGERISALEGVESVEREAPETGAKAPHGTAREMPEQAGEAEWRPEAERSGPASRPVEGGDDAGGSRDREPEEPAREKGIELELELELEP